MSEHTCSLSFLTFRLFSSFLLLLSHRLSSSLLQVLLDLGSFQKISNLTSDLIHRGRLFLLYCPCFGIILSCCYLVLCSITVQLASSLPRGRLTINIISLNSYTRQTHEEEGQRVLWPKSCNNSKWGKKMITPHAHPRNSDRKYLFH